MKDFLSCNIADCNFYYYLANQKDMSNLEKANNQPAILTDYLIKHNLNIKVGDIFAASDSYHPHIKIAEIKMKDENSTPYIHYDCNSYEDPNEWRSYGSDHMDRFINRYGSVPLTHPIEHYEEEANLFLKGEIDLDQYEDKQELNTETSLIHLGSKDNLTALKGGLEEKANHIQLIHAHVKIVMEKKRRELEVMRDKLNGVLVDFKRKISKLEKIIWTIELYLGINENIVQINDGPEEPADSIIYFRQEIMYMDEEVGDPTDQGLDFKRIEDFDDWITKNIDKVIPEQKCVTVFRVRREDKKYHSNPYINSMLNQDNRKTYILIRNGDKLFRIWADINIYPRLFPRRDEFIKVQMEIAEKVENGRDSYVKRLQEKLEDDFMRYQRQLIMLQGLLDRTDTLTPYGEPIKLLSPEIHESGRVKFIYDDEIKLPDTRIPFWDWHTKVNEGLQEGDRVILNEHAKGCGFDPSYNDIQYRFDNRFGNKYNIPNPPNEGLYTVKKSSYKKYSYSEKKELTVSSLVIRYNPGDTVYNLWDYYGDDNHTRKVNLSYKIYPDDSFLLNFDKADLDDVEFYLNSRINRRFYLKMMPLLHTIKLLKLQEIEAEKDFITMMQGELKVPEKKIKEAIKWWKTKNKWKRSLKSDDAKAYRMIKQQITRTTNNLAIS